MPRKKANRFKKFNLEYEYKPQAVLVFQCDVCGKQAMFPLGLAEMFPNFFTCSKCVRMYSKKPNSNKQNSKLAVENDLYRENERLKKTLKAFVNQNEPQEEKR